MRVRHRDGHYVWVEATGSPVFDPGTGALVEILGVNRDISDRMRLEHELYEAQRAEVAARLASSATHDLNNLLLTIIAFGESLQASLPRGSEQATDAQEISRAALNAGKLTRQLLGLTRPPRHEVEVFSVNDVVAQVATMVARVHPECSVRTHLEPGAPGLLGESGRLEQVLLNLALNACSAGGGAPTHVELSTRLDGDRVILTCADDGPGVPEDLRDRILEPFFTTRAAQGGSGIGLSTARRIVEDWGGTVTAHASPAGGAAFVVSLPAAPAAESEPLPPPATGGRVLVIEPQPTIRTVLRRYFEHSGFGAVCVSHEEEALRAFSSASDLVMILADDRNRGWDLARALDQRRATPRILTSGSCEAPVDLGPHEVYLSKPFSSGDLTAAVRRLLGPSLETPRLSRG